MLNDRGSTMTAIRVAVLGACGWMGKVHTMAYQNIPFLFGQQKGSATVAWLVDGDRHKLADTGKLVPAARLSSDWRDAVADPNIDLLNISLPPTAPFGVAK